MPTIQTPSDQQGRRRIEMRAYSASQVHEAFRRDPETFWSWWEELPSRERRSLLAGMARPNVYTPVSVPLPRPEAPE